MDFELEPKKKGRPTKAVAKRDTFDVESTKAQFDGYHAEIELAHQKAKAHIINSLETELEAVSMVGDLAKLIKAIEAKTNKFIKEPHDYVKSIRGFTTPFIFQLLRIKKILREKTSRYQDEKELARRVLEAEQRAAQEKMQAELKAKAAELSKTTGITIEAPVMAPFVAPKVETVIRTENGTTQYYRKEWKCEVICPSDVPRMYCSPDMILLRLAVKGGIRDIIGCKIEEKTIPVTRT